MDLRHKFPQSLKGANLKQLIDHSLVLGFNARPVRLELEELHQLRMPCILHWDLNHFVVLQKISGNKITLLDPALGIRVVSHSEVSQHFTGIALELTPQADFTTKPSPKAFPLSMLTGKLQGFGQSIWSRSMAARFPKEWREKTAHVGGDEGDNPIKQEVSLGADAFTRTIAGITAKRGEGGPSGQTE